MIDDGVALLGDAAFVARPHLGGVTKGFLDAMALGEALYCNISIEHALQQFETERCPSATERENAKNGRAHGDQESVAGFPVRQARTSIRFFAAPGDRVMIAFQNQVDLSQCPWPEWVKQDFSNRRGNGCVGQVLAAESERARVWHLNVPPGERYTLPRTRARLFLDLHLRRPREISRCAEREVRNCRVEPQAGFELDLNNIPLGTFKIHDLQNTGDIALVFVTVEFLGQRERSTGDPGIRQDVPT